MAAQFRDLLNNIPGVFYRCQCDEHWTMLYMSEGIEDLSGYSVDEIVNNSTHSFASLIHDDDAARVDEVVNSAVESHGPWDVEYRLRTLDNGYIWVHERGVGVRDKQGELMYLDGFVVDISERKSIEEALHQSELRVRELAFYDRVTKLPNRNLIFERIESQIAVSNRAASNFSLLFIDLDGFKAVNDEHGHSVGDQLLAGVARLLKSAAHSSDTIARIGGDEFVVLAGSAQCLQSGNQLAERIVKAFAEPLKVGQLSLNVTASVGICQFPQHGKTRDQLIRAADTAMYQAKHSGKNRYSVCDIPDIGRVA